MFVNSILGLFRRKMNTPNRKISEIQEVYSLFIQFEAF
jgi:hypothetical protein